MTRTFGRRKRGKQQPKRRRLRAFADARVAANNEPLGWWDYDETDCPTLINRFSGERLRMGPTVPIAGRPWDQNWVRLDYLHHDLAFPVLACWMPERGHIVVDYLSSVALWHEEMGGTRPYPPYGAWVRVDDCVMDGIWCWPGTLAALHQNSRRHRGPEQGAVGFIGGWCNGAWRPEFLRVTTALGSPENVAEYIAENKRSFSETAVHLPLHRLTSLEEPAPSPWTFIDVTSYEEHERLGHTHFEGLKLVHFKDLSERVRDHPYWLPEGSSDSVAIHGTVPQMRARDGSRVFYPLGARIEIVRDWDDPEQILGPSHGSIRYACLESGLTGVMGWWAMSGNLGGSRDLEMRDRLDITIGLRGAKLRQSDDKEYQVVDRIGVGWSDQGRSMSYESHGPWVLSAESRRRQTRLVQDARLFWRGTEQRPECWNVVDPDILSYRGQGTVTVRSGLLGGTLLGYDIHARLGNDRPWTQDGFTLGPFMGKT